MTFSSLFCCDCLPFSFRRDHYFLKTIYNFSRLNYWNYISSLTSFFFVCTCSSEKVEKWLLFALFSRSQFFLTLLTRSHPLLLARLTPELIVSNSRYDPRIIRRPLLIDFSSQMWLVIEAVHGVWMVRSDARDLLFLLNFAI